MELVRYLHQAREGDHSAQLLSADYSKAFDRVDVTLAMQKPITLGMPSDLLPWFLSILSNRRQRVRDYGALLDWLNHWCGVWCSAKDRYIGSCGVLGHGERALLRIHRTDGKLSTTSHWPYIVKFVVLSAKGLCKAPWSGSARQLTLTTCVSMQTNCATMLVSALRQSQTPARIITNGQEVPNVESLRLLGVTLQSTLKWNLRVDSVTTT